MPEITNRYIKGSDLNKMSVIKIDSKTRKPKIWLDNNGIFYKKEDTNVVLRKKEYFEYFSELDELKACEFPRELLYVDNSLFGYTDFEIKGYKPMDKRLEKFRLSLDGKKLLNYKVIKLVTCLHKNGIVHNDLHPGNLLTDKENIGLIDFVRTIIKELDGDRVFNQRLKFEMYYLNLLVLSILLDYNLLYMSNLKYGELIAGLKIPSEYKDYLTKVMNYDDSVMGIYPDEYIKYLGKKTLNSGKQLINSLNK
ncbi:MAG: hypothetical protein J6J17_01140 [Bacilli bacterium]|nr:hypothetical protein [Bacilli bacterium]